MIETLTSIGRHRRRVDALHDELTTRDCPIEVAPKDFSYGICEMSVRDIDGNRVTFGKEIRAR